MTSTKEILEKIMANRLPGFDAETWYRMEREIEEKMKDFDLQAKINRAKAIEELSKFYITN